MPVVSAFFGIIVRMYFQDHHPPHFHATYAGEEVLVRIDTLVVLAGSISRRAMALVLEWASLHRAALLADWDRAERLQPLEPIPPLD